MSTLKGKQVGKFDTIKFNQQSSTPSLSSGESAIYIKSDGKAYKKVGTSPEVELGAGSSSGGGSGSYINQKLINWIGGSPIVAANVTDGTIGNLQNSAVFDSVSNSVRLNPNTASTNGQLYWDFIQQRNKVNPDFLMKRNFSCSFQFRVGNGSATKGDGLYFYYLTSIIPTTGVQSGTNGYVFYFDEYNDRIAIYYDGTLLSSYTIATLDNGGTQSVIISIIDNSFVINYNGSNVLTYTDPANRNLDVGRYIGVGAWCGSSTAEHFIQNFKIESLGTIEYANVTITDVYNKLKQSLIIGDGIAYEFDDTNLTVKIKENNPIKSINDVQPNQVNGNVNLKSDDIPEGDLNKWYSDQRVLEKMLSTLLAGSNLEINQVNNQLVISVPNVPVADLSAPVIRDRYESNSNRNAFTDSYKSKLDNLPQNLYTDTTFIKVQSESSFQNFIDIDLSIIDWDNVLGVRIQSDFNVSTNGNNLQYRFVDTNNNPITTSIYDWHLFYRYHNTSYGSDVQVNVQQGYFSWRGISDNGVYPLTFDLNIKYFGVGKNYYIEGLFQNLDTSTGYGITQEMTGTVKYTQKINKFRIYPGSGQIKGNFRIFTLSKSLPITSTTQTFNITNPNNKTNNYVTSAKLANNTLINN